MRVNSTSDTMQSFPSLVPPSVQRKAFPFKCSGRSIKENCSVVVSRTTMEARLACAQYRFPFTCVPLRSLPDGCAGAVYDQDRICHSLVSDEKIACTLDLSRQEATTRDESGLWLE